MYSNTPLPVKKWTRAPQYSFLTRAPATNRVMERLLRLYGTLQWALDTMPQMTLRNVDLQAYTPFVPGCGPNIRPCHPNMCGRRNETQGRPRLD